MIDSTQLLGALNLALKECNINNNVTSLDDDRTTNGNASCISFAGALLEGVAGNNYESAETNALDPRPGTIEGFYHFIVQGEPSEYNHGFCVSFLSNKVRIIQVFLGKSTRLIRNITLEAFLAGLSRLRSGEPVQAYLDLFGVDIAAYKVNSIWTTRAK